MAQPGVVAAGVIVVSKGEVLLAHRPNYDDWSFPKGKLERGEHITACAVREVREETSLDVRLGVPLGAQSYPVDGRSKTVRYWTGRVVGDPDVSGYQPNREVDEVRWVPVGQAPDLLSYPHDRETLTEGVAAPVKTRLVVVVRHAKARARSHWRTDDRFRPLLKVGEAQAERLAPLLAAYDVRHLVSSSSTRCLGTLMPYADATGRPIETLDGLSEEDATPESVLETVDGLIADHKRTVLCTHRPVLPDVFFTLGLADPELEPGQMLVIHHDHGLVVATELHQVN